MTNGSIVAVLHDTPDDEAIIEQLVRQGDFDFELFALSPSQRLPQTLRHIKARLSNPYRCVLNLCNGQPEHGDAIGAAAVALLLQRCDLPYGGCRADTLGYSLDVLFMMMWYAKVPLPNFAVVSDAKDACRAAAELRVPVRIRSTTVLLGRYDGVVTVAGDVETRLTEALAQYGALVVWEVGGADCQRGTPRVRAEVLIMADQTSLASKSERGIVTATSALRLYNDGNHADDGDDEDEYLNDTSSSMHKSLHDEVAKWALSFVTDVLQERGYALLTLTLNESPLTADPDAGAWQLVDVELNCALTRLHPSLLRQLPPNRVLRRMVYEAETSLRRSCFALRLQGSSPKGYHLCATRAIGKGEVVFEDEGRSFALVTKRYVERHWSATMKEMFASYAWPIDSEGHTYAIWEQDPTRWRPLNHSCDPNCVFDAPYSLNVVARRPIAEGEDITMDYATFCDGTMRPFSCACGAAQCRKLIVPDEAALRLYGTNAWLRKLPPSSPSTTNGHVH